MSLLLALVAGALFGLLWYALSLLLGAKAYGVLGSHYWVGPIAGVCTGVAMAAISTAFYRRSTTRHLYWYSPMSVYLSVAIYGVVVGLLRLALNDFHPNQIRWAVIVQSIAGMWWGITFLLQVAVVVQVLAYANHRLLRRLVAAS